MDRRLKWYKAVYKRVNYSMTWTFPSCGRRDAQLPERLLYHVGVLLRLGALSDSSIKIVQSSEGIFLKLPDHWLNIKWRMFYSVNLSVLLKLARVKKHLSQSWDMLFSGITACTCCILFLQKYSSVNNKFLVFTTDWWLWLIVPRILFDGWTYQDFESIFGSEDEIEELSKNMVLLAKVKVFANAYKIVWDDIWFLL